MRLCTKTNIATAVKRLVFGWHSLLSAHSPCKKHHKILQNVVKKNCKSLDAHTGAAPDGAQLTHPSALCGHSLSSLSLSLFKAEHRRPQQCTQHSTELTPHHLPGLAIGIPFITSAREKLRQYCLSQASDSFKYPASYFPLLQNFQFSFSLCLHTELRSLGRNLQRAECVCRALGRERQTVPEKCVQIAPSCY